MGVVVTMRLSVCCFLRAECRYEGVRLGRNQTCKFIFDSLTEISSGDRTGMRISERAIIPSVGAKFAVHKSLMVLGYYLLPHYE